MELGLGRVEESGKEKGSKRGLGELVSFNEWELRRIVVGAGGGDSEGWVWNDGVGER